MGRSPCCEKVGLKKGPWTPEEDQKLIAYIEEFGHGSWRALPAKAGLQRCGKSCRLRWTNYLRPDIKRGKFSLQEEQTIIQLHALLGNRWSAIAAQLPKRTDNEIKNYWNTHLKKRLTRMGIDPTTHRPKIDALGGGSGGSGESGDSSNHLSHMAQWESARLEAEARLGRESKLQLHHVAAHNNNNNQLGSSSSCSSSSQPARLVLNKITALQPPLPPCLDVLKAWQNSFSNQPTKEYNNKVMHSMCAMMLSTDDGTLESPTSTLSFPGSTLPLSLPHPLSTTTTTATNIVTQLNENLLPLTSTAVTNTAPNNELWGCSLTNSEGENLQDDDDIMAAVEAFRSTGYENIGVPPPTLSSNTNSNIVLEALNCDEAMVYDSNENLEGGDLPGNRNYWNSILGLVNDTLF